MTKVKKCPFCLYDCENKHCVYNLEKLCKKNILDFLSSRSIEYDLCESKIYLKLEYLQFIDSFISDNGDITVVLY